MNKQKIISALPEYGNNWKLIAEDQTVNDIIREMLAAHKDFSSDYDLICAEFYGGNTLKKLFDFCKKNLPYKVESDRVQTSRSTVAILKMGDVSRYGLDCKHYAQFIGGVLSALNRAGLGNYKWKYRFASYDGSRYPDHVFIVVKDPEGETWVDPTPIKYGSRYVQRSFNDRQLVPTYYKDKKISDMALYRVSGNNVSTYGPVNPHTNNAVGGLAAEDLVPGASEALAAASAVIGFLPDGAFKDFLMTIVNDPVGAVIRLIKGRTYTSGDYVLAEYYMRAILGMAEIQTRGQVPDGMVPQSWLFWSVALGTIVRNSDDLTALSVSAQTYLTRPNSAGLQADPAQAERASKIVKAFDFPQCQIDNRRNTPWVLSKFASIPYVGRMPGAEYNSWYTGTHPITGKVYADGYITSGGSGMTQGGGGGLNPLDPNAPPKQAGFGKGFLILGGVLLGGYALANAAGSSKPKRKN